MINIIYLHLSLVDTKDKLRRKKGKASYGQELSEEDLLPWFVEYQLEMYNSTPNEQLPIAVDHILLRTMASETVDSIDMCYTLLFYKVYAPRNYTVAGTPEKNAREITSQAWILFSSYQQIVRQGSDQSSTQGINWN